MVAEVAAAYARWGAGGENATYHIHPSTLAYRWAVRFPGRIFCLEVRRDLLVKQGRGMTTTGGAERVERMAAPLRRSSRSVGMNGGRCHPRSAEPHRRKQPMALPAAGQQQVSASGRRAPRVPLHEGRQPKRHPAKCPALENGSTGRVAAPSSVVAEEVVEDIDSARRPAWGCAAARRVPLREDLASALRGAVDPPSHAYGEPCSAREAARVVRLAHQGKGLPCTEYCTMRNVSRSPPARNAARRGIEVPLPQPRDVAELEDACAGKRFLCSGRRTGPLRPGPGPAPRPLRLPRGDSLRSRGRAQAARGRSCLIGIISRQCQLRNEGADCTKTGSAPSAGDRDSNGHSKFD